MQQYAFHKRTRKGKVIRIVQEKYLRSDANFGYVKQACLSESDLRDIVSKAPHKQLLVIDTNIALHQIDVLEYKCPATALIVVLQTVLQELRHLNLATYRRLTALLKDDNRSYVFYPNELSASTLLLRPASEIMNDFNDRSIRRATQFYNSALSGVGNAVMISNDRDNQAKANAEGLNSMSMRGYVNKYLHQYPELLDLLAADTSPLPTDASADVSYHQHLPMSEISIGLKAKRLLKGTIRCCRDDWTQCYVVVHTAEGEPRRSVTLQGGYCVNRAVDGDVVAVELISVEQAHESQKAFQRVCDRNKATLDATGRGIGNSSQHAAAAGVTDLTAEPSAEALEGLVDVGSSIIVTQDDTGEGIVGMAVEGEEDSVEMPTLPSFTGAIAAGVVASTVSEAGAGGGVSGTNKKTMVTAVLYGRVVGIIRRNWRQYAGSLDTSGISEKEGSSSGSSLVAETSSSDGAPAGACSILFLPVERRVPPVLISTRRKDELMGQRVLVAIDHWPANSLHPHGHYVRALGRDGDKAVETQVLLHEFDVPHEAFSAEVMACLPSASWAISEDIIAQRTDLRHLPVVSIDPPGCKDIDDALHCLRLPNGHLQVGVHIADVTYFVHPESPLDKEAAHRSTSTYLVERRLDMLPGLLTTQLCSLRSKEDHLAFSVLWEMDDDGNILDATFCKTVIHSVASLTYDEAQAMLDSTDQADEVTMSVKMLNKIARILRQRRIDMGALTLASPEVRFKLDSETQNPTDVSAYALKESNALVEEFMLLANISVSKKILRHFPTLAVLRRHQPPSREQFAPLLSAAQAVGVCLDISSSKTLADSLDAATREGDPYFNKLLRILSTRCMMPAQYFCSGEIPKEHWHHYGLAAPVYTHFTSPIRRYADVIVHRLLAASIGVISLPAGNADRGRQQDLCSHMNRRHKAAQHSQRASVNLHTLLFFKHRPSVETAYVLSVTPEAIVVIVPRFGIEGSLSVPTIAAKLGGVATCDAETHTIVIEGSESASIAASMDDGNDSHVGTTPNVYFRVGVFQQVSIRIRVREIRGGDRRLILSLLLDGREITDEPQEEEADLETGDGEGEGEEMDRQGEDDDDDEEEDDRCSTVDHDGDSSQNGKKCDIVAPSAGKDKSRIRTVPDVLSTESPPHLRNSTGSKRLLSADSNEARTVARSECMDGGASAMDSGAGTSSRIDEIQTILITTKNKKRQRESGDYADDDVDCGNGKACGGEEEEEEVGRGMREFNDDTQAADDYNSCVGMKVSTSTKLKLPEDPGATKRSNTEGSGAKTGGGTKPAKVRRNKLYSFKSL